MMRSNPYEPPKGLDCPDSRWRIPWKLVCLGSLCSAGFFYAAGKLLLAFGREWKDVRWFKIADGLLALGDLASWTMVGLAGIGWFLTRRQSGKPDAP